MAAVTRAKPEAVLHDMTALTGMTSGRRFDAARALPSHRPGRPSSLCAPSVRRVIATTSCPRVVSSLAAIRHLESAVLSRDDMDTVVLRYGSLYGPGALIGEGGSFVEDVRKC